MTEICCWHKYESGKCGINGYCKYQKRFDGDYERGVDAFKMCNHPDFGFLQYTMKLQLLDSEEFERVSKILKYGKQFTKEDIEQLSRLPMVGLPGSR